MDVEIKKLIGVFEKLLPLYIEQHQRKILVHPFHVGLCLAAIGSLSVDDFDLIGSTMDRYEGGYYINIINSKGLLFPAPKRYSDLKVRIDFMKSEIKSLKRLMKKGYTHV